LVVIALVGTMSALVLGLLISSAKGTYGTRRNELLQILADIVLLDNVLAQYGPEALSRAPGPRVHEMRELSAPRNSSSLWKASDMYWDP
jgi:hypothetical protein